MSTNDYLHNREAADKQRQEQLKEKAKEGKINAVELGHELEKLQHKTLEEIQKDIEKEKRSRAIDEAWRRAKELELQNGKER